MELGLSRQQTQQDVRASTQASWAGEGDKTLPTCEQIEGGALRIVCAGASAKPRCFRQLRLKFATHFLGHWSRRHGVGSERRKQVPTVGRPTDRQGLGAERREPKAAAKVSPRLCLCSGVRRAPFAQMEIGNCKLQELRNRRALLSAQKPPLWLALLVICVSRKRSSQKKRNVARALAALRTRNARRMQRRQQRQRAQAKATAATAAPRKPKAGNSRKLL